MKIRIKRSCFVGGKPVAKNKVVDLDEKEAKFLISIKKAEAVKPKTTEKPEE